jgi:hypothetical protein
MGTGTSGAISKTLLIGTIALLGGGAFAWARSRSLEKPLAVRTRSRLSPRRRVPPDASDIKIGPE